MTQYCRWKQISSWQPAKTVHTARIDGRTLQQRDNTHSRRLKTADFSPMTQKRCIYKQDNGTEIKYIVTAFFRKRDVTHVYTAGHGGARFYIDELKRQIDGL